jgi:hypothetical protein
VLWFVTHIEYLLDYTHNPPIQSISLTGEAWKDVPE